VRHLLRPLLAVVATAALAAGCATEAEGDPLAGGDGGFQILPEAGGDLDDDIDEPIQPDTQADDDGAPSSDEVVEASLVDVDAYWSRTYASVYGAPWEPISGGFWPYGPGSEQPPCGSPPPDYSEIAGNAFYCPGDDLIAWDAVQLIPGLYDEFGGFTIGIVMAHEFAHAIQDRAGTTGPTILTELQADCFAGAWTADVEAGNATFFELTLDDLDRAVAGFLTLRDGVGTSATDPAAHGTGFDRIGAFADGFELGPEHCAEYPELLERGELVIVEVPFTSEADFETGGNLPLEELIPLVLEDLEDFWAVLFDEQGRTWAPVADVVALDPARDEVRCGEQTFVGTELEGAAFYCTDDDTIYVDAVGLIPALNDIGDYAVATEIARQYAYAAQARLGILDDTLASNLQADCFAGLYASSGFLDNRPNQVLSLSPGDLDEAVVAFLQTSDDPSGEEMSVGTAFQRFDAFRSGFIEGTPACESLLRR
jgi:predicted metalloprotease